MAKYSRLMDRIDTIRANSVSDKEFEEVWGKSLDEHVEKMMDRWDVLLAQAKKSIKWLTNGKNATDEAKKESVLKKVQSTMDEVWETAIIQQLKIKNAKQRNCYNYEREEETLRHRETGLYDHDDWSPRAKQR